MTAVPFFDMSGHLAAIRAELDEAQRRVIASGWTILGPELEAFENEFAAYCGAKHCVGVGTGLDALALALRARSIGPGHEVIVPAQTFVATWLAVSMVGATPVPVEIDSETANLDPAAVRAAITSRTAAIIPVHLFGQSCDMDSLANIASAANAFLLEDAAQAHGARWRGKVCGGLGDAAAFSFYPTKNLGALGDGGAIVTNDEGIANHLRRLRNYGSEIKYHHDELGTNSRLDELQAAFLRVKLSKLDLWNQRRREIAALYSKHLGQCEAVTVPVVDARAEHVYHLYVVRAQFRDRLQQDLARRGISTQIHYPIPPYLQKCYSQLAIGEGVFPAAERHARECLSLPIWPQMSDEQVFQVIEGVRSAAS